jgi:hypothetical protein
VLNASDEDAGDSLRQGRLSNQRRRSVHHFPD